MEKFCINKEIIIEAPIQDVFSSLTNSEEIPKYYPLKSVESDWIEGSEILYKGEINGNPFTDYGTIEKIASPTHFRYRYWSDNHGTKRTDDNHLTIEYILKTESSGTKVLVTQSDIISKEMYVLMNTQVWDYLLSSFKEYMENRT